MSHRLRQQAQHITTSTTMADQKRPNITLYTDSTPNGLKASIALEELGLTYKTEHIDISTNRQKEPWFLEINPNGRIPAMTDTFSDGQTIRLFESGGIFQYLVDEYDKEHKISFPKGTREYYEMTNWVFFQNAGMWLVVSQEFLIPDI
jgi:glutathione S-transferase